MKKVQIAIIVGSLRKDSFNLKLARSMTKLAPKNLDFKFLQIGNLPLYNQEHDIAQHDTVKIFKKDILNSDGIIFVTPEYNRSMPGVLKNAIDHASRPYGQSAWAKKPSGILGASVGSIGTALAQQHLRAVLAHLDVPTLGQPEAFIHVKDNLFDNDDNITNPDTKNLLQKWMDTFVEFINHH